LAAFQDHQEQQQIVKGGDFVDFKVNNLPNQMQFSVGHPLKGLAKLGKCHDMFSGSNPRSVAGKSRRQQSQHSRWEWHNTVYLIPKLAF
jgi:hypothetical protein